MALKKREISREDWPRIEKRTYCYRLTRWGKQEGAAALIHAVKVKKPLAKPGWDGKPVTLLDNGYSWLQFAPRGEHWWLTAMFDPQGELIQCYFDITAQNCIFPQQAYFFDLYLDFVLTPPGHLVRLDDRELEEAYASGQLEESLYRLALRAGGMLERELSEKREEFFSFCLEQYRILKPLCR